MSETTRISWASATFNPFIGCTKVSPGCTNCYAAVSTAARSLGVKWGAGEPRRRTSAANWAKPIRWQKLAERGLMPDGKTPTNGQRPRVFCASLADVFDNEVPSHWRADLFDLIGLTPSLDWLLLTKRIGNAAKMVPWCRPTPLGVTTLPWDNVWLGASIVNQEEADRDIPKLLATPAAVRFLSLEPLLSPVSLRWLPAWNGFALKPRGTGDTNHLDGLRKLNWVIIGGESSQPGHPARPFDIQWARDTVRQCREAGVACFVKQLGSAPFDSRGADGIPNRTISGEPSAEDLATLHWTLRAMQVRLKDRAGADPAEWPEDLRVQEWPDDRLR